jgi:hypothetical protein
MNNSPLNHCGACGQSITLADDGAWEDFSGACGCGDDEHYPEPDARTDHYGALGAYGPRTLGVMPRNYYQGGRY